MVNYFLEKYATADVIAEAEADVANFMKPTNMTVVRYSEDLWEKDLKCGKVYGIPRLKGIFIEALLFLIAI